MENKHLEKIDDSKKEITFEKFDKLGRKEFADRLTTIITKFYPFHDEASVLSLNAKFGAGKTTFLEMWKNQLTEDGFSVISINAWETDFDDEPLIPIISALLDGIPDDKKIVEAITAEAITALKETLAFIAFAANDGISHVTGVDVGKTIKKVDGNTDSENIEAIGNKLYEKYSFKMEAYKTLKLNLSTYIEAMPKKPLIIFVDELDRVRPNYSVKFLEAIKHIFSLQGVCFVLAVNREQMEASVRQLYGDIDFENYYRRFITREVELTEAKNLDLMPFILSQADRFLNRAESAGINFAIRQQSNFSVFTSTVCNIFNLAPREIETLFRMFSQLMAVEKSQETAKESWINGSILLIAIFIKNRSLYNRIGAGLVSTQELYEYIKGLNLSGVQNKIAGNLFVMTAISCSMQRGNQDELNEITDIYCRHGSPEYSDEEPEERESRRLDILNGLSKYLNEDGWGGIPTTPVFQEIYTLIEEWQPFLK